VGKRKATAPRINKAGVYAAGLNGIRKQASSSPNFAGSSIGGAFPTSQTPSFFYSPELTVESFLLPKYTSFSTKILLADGSTPTLGELAKKDVRHIPVVSYNLAENKFCVEYAHSSQCHGRNVPLLKIVFSDGSTISSGKEHEFYLSNGNTIASRSLKKGDSILTQDDQPLYVDHIEDGGIADGYDAINVTNNYNYVVLTSSGRKIVTKNSRVEILKWSQFSDKVLSLDGIYHKDELTDDLRFVTITNDSEQIKQLKKIAFTGDVVSLKVKSLGNFPLEFTYGHPILALRDGHKPGISIAGHSNVLNKFTGELLDRCIQMPVQNLTTRDWVVLPRFLEEKILPTIDLFEYVKNSQRYFANNSHISYFDKKFSRFIKWEPEFFNFLGWCAAENTCTGRSLNLSLNIDENEIAHSLGKYIIATYGGYYNISHKKGTKGISLNINNVPLAIFINQSLGNSKAPSKTLPDWLMYTSKENVEAFLRGWLGGNGTQVRDRVKGVTASRRMGGQLFWLFTKIGIIPHLNLDDSKRGNICNGVEVIPTQPYYVELSVFGKDLERFGYTSPKINRAKYLKDSKYFYLPISEIKHRHVVGEAYDFLTADTTTAVPILNFNCKTLGDLITEAKPEEIRAINIEQQALSASGKFTPIVSKFARKYSGEICKVKVNGIPEFEVTDAKVLMGIKVVRGHWTNQQQKEFVEVIKSKTYPSEKYLTWITASLLKANDILVVPKCKEFSIEKFDLANYIPKAIRKFWFYSVTNDFIEVKYRPENINFKLPRFISTDNEPFIRLFGAYLSGGTIDAHDKHIYFAKDISSLLKDCGIPSLLLKIASNGFFVLKFPILSDFLQQYFGRGTLLNKNFPKWVFSLPLNTSQELLNSLFIWGSNRRTDTIWCDSSQKSNQLFLLGLRANRILRREVTGQIQIINKDIETITQDDKFYYLDVEYVNIEKVINKPIEEITTKDHSLCLPVAAHNCRIFYNLDPYIKSIIEMHSLYPFSKFDIITSDPSVTAFYKDVSFSDSFDLYEHILKASLSYCKFGESLHFGNMIQDEEDGMWKWQNFILLEPELVEVRQELFEDKPRFELVPTEELKQLCRSTDQVAQERQKKVPDVVLESVRNNRLIPLDSDQVSMIARITDPSATRGTSPIQCCFKPLIWVDWLRLATAAFYQRYVFPIELWQIGDASQGIWPTEDDLEKFKNTINLAVQSPPFSLVFPPIVKYEALSTSGKSFFPVANELASVYEQIMVGLGVNKNIITGEGPNFPCSADTRALTQEGLKYYWQLSKKDKIASFDSETNKLEYVPYEEIFVKNYEGEMIHFKTQKIDHLVTPNHNCWVQPNNGGKSPWQFRQAKDIGHRSHFRLGIDWDGDEAPKTVKVLDKKIPIETYLKWVGYWLSEGSVTFNEEKGQYDVKFSQSINSQYLNQFGELTEHLPFKVAKYRSVSTYVPANSNVLIKESYDCYTWNISNKNLALYFIDNFGKGAFNKKIPLWIKNLSPKYLKILLDAMMQGDGSIHKPTGRRKAKAHYFTYHTTSNQLAEDVFEISLKCGNTPHISVEKTSANNNLFHVNWSEHKNPFFILDKRGEKDKGQRQHTFKVQYKGKVWCIHLPINHAFICERNGRFIITGNSNVKTMSLHKLMMVYKAIRDQFENWMIRCFFRPLAVKNNLYTIVRGKKKYILPTISWYKSLDIEERDEERKMYHEMWKEGIISTETFFGKFPDLDFATEAIKLQKERKTIFDKGDHRLPSGAIEALEKPENTSEEILPGVGGAPKVGIPTPEVGTPPVPTSPTPPTPPTPPVGT